MKKIKDNLQIFGLLYSIIICDLILNIIYLVILSKYDYSPAKYFDFIDKINLGITSITFFLLVPILHLVIGIKTVLNVMEKTTIKENG